MFSLTFAVEFQIRLKFSNKMSHYKDKSEVYFKVANIIHGQQFFPAVPHDAYYSCFLMMQHLFYVQYSEDFEAVKHEVQLNGTHEVIIEYFTRRFDAVAIDIVTMRNYCAFKNEIGQLKKLRTKADYRNEDISKRESGNSISLAADILRLLKTI